MDLLRGALTSNRPTAERVESAAFRPMINLARQTLQRFHPHPEYWNGKAAYGNVRIRGDEVAAPDARVPINGDEAPAPDDKEVVVVIPPELGHVPLLDVQPGLVWLRPDRPWIVGGGGVVDEPIRAFPTKRVESFVDDAVKSLGCNSDFPIRVVPGRTRFDDGPAARIDCVKGDERRRYEVGAISRFIFTN